MAKDAWLPVGFELPLGRRAKRVLHAGQQWQVLELDGDARALLCLPAIVERWVPGGLLDANDFEAVRFGDASYLSLASPRGAVLAPLSECRAPRSFEEAMVFARALAQSRSLAVTADFSGGLYIEMVGRILPTFEGVRSDTDEVLLGRWLSGGLPIPAGDIRRFAKAVTWLDRKSLRSILEVARIPIRESSNGDIGGTSPKGDVEAHSAFTANSDRRFQLPGRLELEVFFNDHVVDIVRAPDRYRALGILGPPAIVLNGPPGCGKTFAVERLVDFLGWRSFQIDASSIASPYIHETSRKIAEVFDAAIDAAPSVVVIDEMEAFVGDRGGLGGTHSHRVEELAEFLRRIPEATKAGVLIIGMTNRLDLIDPAILRRGRFDHILNVSFASVIEIEAMLENMSGEIPKAADVDLRSVAQQLDGRPLSDASFVLREGARLAAKAGRNELAQEYLLAALEVTAVRGEATARRIGF